MNPQQFALKFTVGQPAWDYASEFELKPSFCGAHKSLKKEAQGNVIKRCGKPVKSPMVSYLAVERILYFYTYGVCLFSKINQRNWTVHKLFVKLFVHIKNNTDLGSLVGVHDTRGVFFENHPEKCPGVAGAEH
jgi:hypothetical protein